MKQDYQHVNCWIFDLDNTLYPPHFQLMSQISTKITEYIIRTLSLPEAEAKQIQRKYYLEFGTSLRGLMEHHQVDPTDFMNYVHDLDYSIVTENKPLRDALQNLPGRKLIHTNASKQHSFKVMQRLGIESQIEAVFDVMDGDYVPKPKAGSYHKFLETHQIDPTKAAMLEDLPQNLIVPAQLGMRTILIEPAHDQTGVVEQGASLANRDHIHHTIEDLVDTLTLLGG
ncbi:MAG: pyrimidine 5'-nucleotidase [Alphaproteobacteria bacterium]